MSDEEPPTPAPEPTAEALVEELRAALAQRGIVFPSLEIDALTAHSRRWPRPLIELGRINLPTARRLAAALRGEEL
jgi:hypothetical protein